MSKKFKENNEAIENEVVDTVVDEAVAETQPIETKPVETKPVVKEAPKAKVETADEVKSFKRGTVTL